MAKKLTKSQTEMLILGLIIAAILGLLAYNFLKPSENATTSVYRANTVDKHFSTAVLQNPEYYKLSAPVQLPLDPGPHGRKNPFETP